MGEGVCACVCACVSVFLQFESQSVHLLLTCALKLVYVGFLKYFPSNIVIFPRYKHLAC